MVVLLLVIGSLVALVLQNWSPVLPLVLLGTTTIALPLAIWISVFIGAGVLTSLLLQVINYRPSRAKAAPVAPQADPDLPPPPPRREMPKPPPSQQPRSDWETSTAGNDWTTSTSTSTTPPKPREPSFEKRSSPPPQPPQTPPRDRQAEVDASRSPNDVYDANFRVINQSPPEVNPTDEEDWGFDDEELETEYRRNWPSS